MMITTIELSQSITEKQYRKVVELLKEIGISVKTDDTKLTKAQMLEKIEKSSKQKGTLLKSKEDVTNFFDQ